MPSVNKVVLAGHLVSQPELKTTQSGVSVCSLRIGVSRKYKDKDGKYQSDFFDAICWRQTAEYVSKYGAKGRAVCICGALQQRSWTDKQGQKRYTVEVVADEVSFLDKAEKQGEGDRSTAEQPGPPSTGGGFEDIGPEDDLPF